MNQFDVVLKMYSDGGLRTIEDWTNRGRDIAIGSKPRVDTTHRGTMLSLYSRDQTRIRMRTQPK